MTLRLAFSPCPNDTFVFHALAHGKVADTPPFEITYADVDVTNTAAERGEFDLVKVSYAALPWLLDDYELLPCGGALGRGCGPLVLVNDASLESVPPEIRTAGLAGARSSLESVPPEIRTAGLAGARSSLESVGLAGKSVAVPGDRTTAYLLMRLWSADAPPASVTVVPFASIMPAVAEGRFDAGLVIHEARFTYPRHGLRALVDLGEWWESDTGLPIPLGAILARRGVVSPVAATEWVRASVRAAWADPGASSEYVLAHAQEMEPDVVARHIDLYVNSFTEDLGEEGYRAANALLQRAADAGLVPRVGRLTAGS